MDERKNKMTDQRYREILPMAYMTAAIEKGRQPRPVEVGLCARAIVDAEDENNLAYRVAMATKMRNLVDRVEELYNSAKDETHSAEQAALNGVNKAQEKAQEITLRNIDEATQRSKKAIDTMVLESKRRIERLAMVTLPDRMFHFLKWTALMLVLFILVHIVWQMFS